MNKTAIDVVLLPSAAMTAKTIEINQELLKTFDNKIILDAKKCLPHISLCMGVVDDRDISEVTKIVKNIAHELPAFTLTAKNIKSATIPTGKKVSGLTLANSDDLQRLHESIMRKLRRLLSYEVETSMLYNPSEVEDVTLVWIEQYGKKHDDPTLFHPHMTVGFGETDAFSFPVEFTADTLALCRLGNYCTCRKVIAAFDLY
jgi:2'-5' RNA ligase